MTNRRLFLALSLLLTTGCGGDKGDGSSMTDFSVMSFNVGNSSTGNPDYLLRMSNQAYEDFVAGAIAEQRPDVVVLQEVLPRHTCEAFQETDSGGTCYGIADREDPVRRLLGPDYSIVCDARKHIECIGVHVDFGPIAGVDEGGYAVDGAETPELPLPPCFWGGGECVDDSTCDAESTVSAATVRRDAGDLRVVHVHPHAPNFPDAWGAPCRTGQLTQALDELVDPSADNLVLGDFNIDPNNALYAGDDADWWQAHVVDGAWTIHDATAPDGTPYATNNLPVAIDHVLSDGAAGDCTVHGGNGLDPDPPTLPLDAGFDWSLVPDGPAYTGRIDHRAITCELRFEAAATADSRR